MTAGYLPIAGSGVCLPCAASPAELFDRLAAYAPLAGARRRLTAENTGLPPLDVPVGLCDDAAPRGGERQPRLGGLRRESRLALTAAADALTPPAGVDGDQVGVVWVSSTAGLEEYGQTCVAAATLDAGQASPLTAAESGFNGPAAAVSIRLGLTGPHLTLTGCRDAGMAALVEAGRMLSEGRCRHVLVGGSASVSRWRMVGATAHAVPVEGAVCLLLGGPTAPDRDGSGPADRDGAARPLRRARLRGARPAAALVAFVLDCVDRMDAPPDAIVVSAADPWWERAASAVNGRARRWWWVDRAGGEMGAAGGLQAVVAAVAGCGGNGASGLSRVLALAVGSAGDVAAVEVVSREVVSRDIGSRRRELADESV